LEIAMLFSAIAGMNTRAQSRIQEVTISWKPRKHFSISQTIQLLAAHLGADARLTAPEANEL